ncbi:MAG: TolC family protein [Spirochaetia bacterium]|nr:TolC family protein [Spirochaetia bacterium]
MKSKTSEKYPGSALCIIYCSLIAMSNCGAPEIKLRDNKMEPVIEKTISNYTPITNGVYKKALDKKEQSIDDIFILALDRSEKIAIGAEDLFQAREKTRQAWGAVLPQVSFRANVYTLPAAPTGGSFNQGYRFYARQSIMTGLDEYSAIEAAPLNEKYSALRLKEQAALLYDQISQIFYKYLLLQDSLKTQNILLESSSDLKNELEKRFYLGKIRRSEILSVEAVIAKTQAQLVNTEVLISEAQKNIRSLAGLDRDFTPENPGSEDNFNSDHYPGNFFGQPENVQKRPDLAALKTAWELAKITTLNVLGGHLPSIYLEGQYRIPNSSEKSTTGIPDFYGGIVAQFPLFSGGIVHSQYLAAKSQEYQAELRYRELLRTAGEELDFYVHSWQAGEKQLSLLKTAKDRADNAYNTTLADYGIGQATNLEVLSALNNQAAARDEFEKTTLNQKLLIVHIKILAGELP